MDQETGLGMDQGTGAEQDTGQGLVLVQGLGLNMGLGLVQGLGQGPGGRVRGKVLHRMIHPSPPKGPLSHPIK